MYGLSMKNILGEFAVHVPFHGIVQQMDDGKVLCVFASKVLPVNPLLHGCAETHVFLHGDMIVRPTTVMASNHCRGYGISGLVTSSAFYNVTEWADKGRALRIGGKDCV